MTDLSGYIPIKGFEDYLINKEGRVYSTYAAKFKKQIIGANGYFFVSLVKKGKNFNKYVHRLIAIHFIPNPHNYRLVLHGNDIRTDNRIKNLRWGTDRQNMEDKFKNGYIHPGRLSREDVVEIYFSTDHPAVVMEKFNIVSSYLSRIKNKKLYKAYTKDFPEAPKCTRPKSICRKLSDEQVKYILGSSESHIFLAQKFSVHKDTIKNIRKRKFYKEI